MKYAAMERLGRLVGRLVSAGRRRRLGRLAPLGILGMGLGAAACQPPSFTGCRNDNDCKGDRVCDPAALVCVDPRTAPSTDLASSVDMAQPAGDLAPPATGAFFLSKRFGGGGDDQAYAIAADRAGFVVAGTFQGTVDFGGGPLSAQGGNDVFLVRYSGDGAFQWARALGGVGDDLVYGVSTDGGGAVAIAGAFTGTADLGGDPLKSAGGYDVFVARYGPDGKHLFSLRAGGAGDDAASSVASDAQGELAVAGYFSGTAPFGGEMLVSAGDLDAFLARVGADGKVRLARGFGGGGEDVANRVALDGKGNAVLVGYLHGSASFGGDVLSSAGGSDLFVARYAPDGAHLWSKRFGGAADDSASAVAIDPSGAATVFGLSLGAADLGGGVLMGPEPYGLLLARYGADGKHQWSRRFGSSAPARAGNVAVDAGGWTSITGSFNDALSLGGEPLGNGGLYVARYAPSGAHLWSRRFGGLGNAYGLGVAADPAGNVLTAGAFSGTIDFGGGPQQSAGGTDAFVLKLAP